MHIGPYRIDPPLVLAPMAGVTDRPFRNLCKRLGAGLAVSEMTASDPRLWDTRKSSLRRNHTGEQGPISVQIAGYDPEMMAQAARLNVDLGAQIIDINMGCPAKKVCKVDAGSALMKDESLVKTICEAVVDAVPVPVTLKIRTGWARSSKNGPQIARIAEDSGIAALAIHGRTREDLYSGDAEYDTIAAIRQAIRIPLLANGDIGSPEKAKKVLALTQADGLMIGRAALGRPWIFREISHYLTTGERLPQPQTRVAGNWLLAHLDALYDFYGETQGARVARKHIKWYCQSHPGSDRFWQDVCAVNSAAEQRSLTADFFALAGDQAPRAA